MNRNVCTDCGIEPTLHAEVATKLRNDAPCEEERVELVRAALERADHIQPARRRLSRLWSGLGVAAALVVLFVMGRGVNEEGLTGEAPRGYVKERAANRAYLERPEIVARLAKAIPGSYVVVVRGKRMEIDNDLRVLLDRVRRDSFGAQHRFVFRLGEQGDAVYSRSVEREGLAGARLGVRAKDKSEVEMHLGAPDRVDAVSAAILVSLDSKCPLILPRDTGFPLFEIPGAALVGKTSYRRYLVRVRAPDLGMDRLVEALGNISVSEDRDGNLHVAGHVWLGDAVEARKRSLATRKPLLVLKRSPELVRFPGNPFEGMKNVDTLLAPYVLSWDRRGGVHSIHGPGIDPDAPIETRAVLAVYHPNLNRGPMWSHPLLIGRTTTRKEIREYLIKMLTKDPPSLIDEAGNLIVGGQLWLKDEKKARADAQNAGKPLLVLNIPKGGARDARTIFRRLKEVRKLLPRFGLAWFEGPFEANPKEPAVILGMWRLRRNGRLESKRNLQTLLTPEVSERRVLDLLERALVPHPD